MASASRRRVSNQQTVINASQLSSPQIGIAPTWRSRSFASRVGERVVDGDAFGVARRKRTVDRDAAVSSPVGTRGTEFDVRSRS